MKYIGIDIGDGESAITVVSEQGTIIPTVVMLGNVASIRSVVGDLNSKPIIGDSVMLNHAVTNRSARFKSKFLTDIAAREDLRRFANGLYELFRKSVKDTDIKIALGCPAQWPAEVRERYASIVLSAGFSNVYTVSESRAAYLYAHRCNTMNLSPELLKRPTLVIDMGSSTLDYAYIVNGKERDVGVFGENHLGGGILDSLILEEAISCAPNGMEIHKVLDQSHSWRSYCELLARKLKEEYFLSEEKYIHTPCTTIAPIYAEPSHPLSLKLALSGDILKKLLDKSLPEMGDKSFRQALRDSLNRANDITNEYPVELLIMTGGASRMRFFREMCTDVFRNATSAICEEPEFSIARGLGIASRTDDMLAQFRGKIATYFESGAVEMEVERQLPHLLPDYLSVISKIICNKAFVKVIKEFKGEASELEIYVEQNISAMLADQTETQEANRIVNEWIGARLTVTQDKLNQLCDEYKIDRTDMSLVKIHAEVKAQNVRMPWILRVFLDEKDIKWKRKFVTWLTKVPMVGDSMRRQITNQLLKSSDELVTELSHKLVKELQMQIDTQTRKVEVQIS